MVEDRASPKPRRAERDLALGYAPAPARAGLAALFALDERLGSILRTTREPLVGQMRLTWWHDAIVGLGAGEAPAEPALQAVAAGVLPAGIAGRDIAAMIDGWEALLDEPLDEDAMRRHAVARGGHLFAIAARLCGAANADPARVAGEGWALADLAGNLSAGRERAGALALPLLVEATRARWSRNGRALGALAHLARLDLERPDLASGAPRRLARLLRHRLTGR